MKQQPRKKHRVERQMPSWNRLLHDAVREPGRILAAYRAFHEFSVGNQLAAYEQCQSRGLPVGPLGTYRQWAERGRQVMRGERALFLCVPRTVKVRGPPREEAPAADDAAVSAPAVRDMDAAVESGPGVLKVFSWQPRWFVLSQTEGTEFVFPSVEGWNRERALTELGVTMIPFASLDGNVQGYAQGNAIAVNPFAALPVKTLFHELGHVLLHQGDAPVGYGVVLERHVREAEAEAVALLCVEALGLPGAEFCRGYIQSWLAAGMDFSERSAQRILAATDRILRAGRSGAGPGAG